MKKDLKHFDKKAIAHGFSQAAKTYDQASVFQREAGARMIERLEYIKCTPESLLELGCGTGHFARILQGIYPKAEIVGVDIAIGMLQEAKTNSKSASKEHYVCADAVNLPFSDNAFDMVFSNMMFHWADDLNQLLQQLYHLLKPGSLLLFSMSGPDTLFELRESWAEIDNDVHVYPFIDMHDVGDLLLKAGFVDPVMDRQMLTLQYPNFKSLLRELKKTGVTNKHPQRQSGLTGKSKFKQLEKNYGVYITEDGKFPASYEIIYGHAWVPDMKPKTASIQEGEVRIDVTSISRNNIKFD